MFLDLNCDLGEHPSSSIDEEIFPYISSCNIACGGHAGDNETMRSTIRLALKNQVAIGAHPSYPDRGNFGRLSLVMEEKEFQAAISHQLREFKLVLKDSTSAIPHIKAHGALYHDLAEKQGLAKAYMHAVKEMFEEVFLVGPPYGALKDLAISLQVPYFSEGFADRAYLPNLHLKTRKEPNSVLSNTKDVLRQVASMVFSKKVSTEEGEKTIEVSTICLHSDTPSSIHLAKSIFEFLTQKNVVITPFR